MSFVTLASVIISITALLGTSPFWSRLLIHHLYKPKLSVRIPSFEKQLSDNFDESIITMAAEINDFTDYSVDWNDIQDDVLIKIRNYDSKSYKYEIEISINQPWNPREGFAEIYNSQVSFRGGAPLRRIEGPSWFKLSGRLIAGASAQVMQFPLIPSTKKMNDDTYLEIELFPKLDMSEFGLPRFFGDTTLKPINKKYKIEYKKPSVDSPVSTGQKSQRRIEEFSDDQWRSSENHDTQVE